MQKRLLLLLLLPVAFCYGQSAGSTTLKSILLQQLKTTHNQKDWFVPVDSAIDGLTAEQASWKDSSGNHSIAQLVNHLIFWNTRQLSKFRGDKADAYNGNNDETFSTADKKSWLLAVSRLDDILKQWEKAIESADESKLQAWYPTIANISTHNAYHTGQIIYIRKLQGSWNPEKGVK